MMVNVYIYAERDRERERFFFFFFFKSEFFKLLFCVEKTKIRILSLKDSSIFFRNFPNRIFFFKSERIPFYKKSRNV